MMPAGRRAATAASQSDGSQSQQSKGTRLRDLGNDVDLCVTGVAIFDAKEVDADAIDASGQRTRIVTDADERRRLEASADDGIEASGRNRSSKGSATVERELNRKILFIAATVIPSAVNIDARDVA